MADMGKVLYVVVLDEEDKRDKGKNSYRYTRPVLQSTLQLMGCKARHAFKISQSVFVLIRRGSSSDSLLLDRTGKSDLDASNGQFGKEDVMETCMDKSEFAEVSGKENKSDSVPFELYKRRTTVIVRRETFLDIVCDILSEYKYVGPNQRADLELACRIRERKESVTVLLCGTSGCGKSTLSALLGSRLGITTVISTDSIRHMMRSFVDEKQNPLLWASTYHAGELLDPASVAEAKAKTKPKELPKNEILNKSSIGKPNHAAEVGSGATELISQKQMVIEGYKAQSEMIIDSLDRLITAWEERKESVVVEGVHLSLNFVMGLMRKHPSIVPFMVYITNEDKHLERFAVRAKYMTLDPAKNKYVKYIRNIRTIQEYLCKRADKHLVPKINNTNVDKSVAAIHATVFGCLRRRETGEQLHDSTTNRVTVVDDEYRNQCAANSLSSKGMFQLIQRQGSSRHFMALVKSDGSVAKAWPVDSYSHGKPSFVNGKEKGTGAPMYGPLQIGRSEPVNLQFGFYGISAWPSDDGTSRAGSADKSLADGNNTSSKYLSSSCSSPRLSDGTSKEVKEENSVHGSDEEPDVDPPGASSDEDISYDNDKQLHDEIGSVDEEFTKSDEEYDDLAMQDVQENGYWSDHDRIAPVTKEDQSTQKLEANYHQNVYNSFRTERELLCKALCSYSSLLMEKNDRKMSYSQSQCETTISQSISSIDKHRSVINDAIISGAP